MTLNDEILELLSKYTFDKKYSTTINNLKKITNNVKSGSLLNYIIKQFDNKNATLRFNDYLKDAGYETILDIVKKYFDLDLEYNSIIDCIENKLYNEYTICAMADDYNNSTGMHAFKNNGSNEVIVTSTMDPESSRQKYSDSWIDEEKLLLKYYAKRGKEIEKIFLGQKPNKLIDDGLKNSLAVPVYVFTRTKKKQLFTYNGIYNAISREQDSNGFYFILKKIDSSKITDKEKVLEDILDVKDIINDIPLKKARQLLKENKISTRNTNIQKSFREILLKHDKKCSICGMDFHPLLVGSHIKPYADIVKCELDDEDKYKEVSDEKNGLLLCNNHDALSDKGYITFETDGKIKCSPSLPDNIKEQLESIYIDVSLYDDYYMEYHRTKIFIRSEDTNY